MKQQKGFTLVEMAIVLVIIGLLLGGVLKGQELIESSKIKNAANDINGTIAAYNGYVDRFRAVPGDDIGAVAGRGAAWASAVAGNGNGQIDGADAFVNTETAGTAENGSIWRHLRAAGFISGNPLEKTVTLPTNAFSGRIGVLSAAAYGIPAGAPKVCMDRVPGKAARALDIAMDDGNPTTGIFKGAAAFNAALAADAKAQYSDDVQYVICRSM